MIRNIDERVCIGCGVCTLTCPTESITLERRPPSDQNLPPANLMKWSRERLVNRGRDNKKE